MKKTKNTSTSNDSGSMLIKKTNEDFNEKPPIPIDFKISKRSTSNKSSIPKLKFTKDENRKTI
jgi:hypothetical protein